MSKQFFMDFFEIIDAGRVFPRLFLLLTAFLIWDAVQWFEGLTDPGTQQASLIVIIVGIIPLILNFYMNSGKNWGCKKDNDNTF